MAENGLAENDGANGDGSLSPTAAPSADMPHLVADHADALYRYAFRLTGAAADAEDLTQQTFLTAHRKLDQLRDVRGARVWLMTVMRRIYCRSQIKSRTEREKTVLLDVDTLSTAEGEVSGSSGGIDRQTVVANCDRRIA